MKKRGRPKGTHKQENRMTERLSIPISPELKLALEQHVRDVGYTGGTAPYIREILEHVVNFESRVGPEWFVNLPDDQEPRNNEQP